MDSSASWSIESYAGGIRDNFLGVFVIICLTDQILLELLKVVLLVSFVVIFATDTATITAAD